MPHPDDRHPLEPDPVLQEELRDQRPRLLPLVGRAAPAVDLRLLPPHRPRRHARVRPRQLAEELRDGPSLEAPRGTSTRAARGPGRGRRRASPAPGRPPGAAPRGRPTTPSGSPAPRPPPARRTALPASARPRGGGRPTSRSRRPASPPRRPPAARSTPPRPARTAHGPRLGSLVLPWPSE